MTILLNNQNHAFRSKLGLICIMFSLAFAQPSFAANILKDIKTHTQVDGKTAITLHFAEPVGDAKAFSMGTPPRIAIDLADTVNEMPQKKVLINSNLAKSISTVEASGRTRVLVDLSKNTTYRTQSIGKTLVLTIDNEAALQNAVAVTAVDFKRSENGDGRLVVKFSESGAISNVKKIGTEILMDFKNAKLPKDLQGKMDVAGYSTPVLNIDVRDEKGIAQVLINTKGKAELMSYQTGNEYVIEISPTASLNSTMANANTGAVASGKKSKAYSGRPVTFNFQDVPVRTVLQLIAEESNLNIVAADTVNGNVTLRLVNVPWDQALEIVLRAKGLDKRRDGNVVWVGPQSELATYEQSKEDARIALETREETITEYIAINYGNAEAIAKLLTENSKSSSSGAASAGSTGGANGAQQQRGFLSPRGSVSFDSRTNTLLLIDIPKKVAEIKQLMLTLDRPVDQVMIEARVVVAGDAFARELGVKFGVNDRYGVDPSDPGKTTDSGINIGLPVSSAAGILNFNLLGKNTSLDLELQAMQTNGKGEVISNPRVITSNQKEAVIKQGEEIGYVTLQPVTIGSVPQSTVEFKEVLLELRVTPTITQDGHVFLNIFVKKDEVKSFFQGPTGNIPQIAKREVSTAVLINNGQTVVLGGVYEFKNREDVTKVPFLGDIPFFNTFFKSSNKTKDKAELLIFVTPRILKPARRME